MEFKKAGQDDRADEAFYNLVVFLTSFNEGDLIFDIDPEDVNRQGAQDPNKSQFKTIPLIYLVGDLNVNWKGRPSDWVAPEDAK